MKCDICGIEFTGGYGLYGKFNICDECGRTYSLKDINDLLNVNQKTEGATQASNVDGGKVDIFGTSNHSNYNDWYKQLFENSDLNKEDFTIVSSNLEDTGGHTMVLFGKLQNGNYFALNEEVLSIYDGDYYEAYKNNDEEDLYEWENEHLVDTYDNSQDEYKIVASQTEEFKPYIDKDALVEQALNDLVTYLNLNTDLEWDFNEIYDNCAISEDDENYIEIFVNIDDNNEIYYIITKDDNMDNTKYYNLQDLIKAI